MNSTYILAGGNDRTTEGYGQLLSDEIAKYVVRPRILSCFFSWPADTWEAKALDWKDWFLKYFGKEISYEYAQPSTFVRQIDSSDVSYLHGGDTRLLFDNLPTADTLRAHFKGKVVVGSSAGANVLSKNYWSSKRAVATHGLALADVNVMVHYGAAKLGARSRTADDWKKEAAEFAGSIGSEEIQRLPEGQFIVWHT